MGLKRFRPAFFIGKIAMQPDITEEIKKLIQPVIDQEQVELVDLIYRREAGRYVLRLLVYKVNGVSLDDCSRINRAISDILDNSDLIQHSFVLEVNSPGLDRPIVTKRDFERNIGRAIKLIMKNAKGTTDTVIGELKGIGEDRVFLDVNGKAAEILISDIIKAKLEIKI